MAHRRTLLLAAALAAGCATGTPRPAAHLTPPAREGRAGAPEQGAGPVATPPANRQASASPAPPRVAARPLPHDAAVHRAVETARGLVGQQEIVVDGVPYGDGCSALVRAAFGEAGHPLPAGVTDVASLHALARRQGALRRGKPAVGDLIFLSDRPGGAPEHVGLVERIGETGTATVLHRTARGVVRLRVNAGQPWKARGEDGRVLNDVLVVGGGRVPVGRLLVAFATLL
jgi:cell wall-associated NlpC family hydrolase